MLSGALSRGEAVGREEGDGEKREKERWRRRKGGRKRLGFGAGVRPAGFFIASGAGGVAWKRRRRACEGDSDRCVSVRGRRWLGC